MIVLMLLSGAAGCGSSPDDPEDRRDVPGDQIQDPNGDGSGDPDGNGHPADDVYIIRAYADNGGTITPEQVEVSEGDMATFTVTPFEGYALDEVWGCDGTLVGDQYTTGPITTHCEVMASFLPIYYVLTYSAYNGGTIDGITPQHVRHGYDGMLIWAVADSGYEFVTWSDGRTDNPRMDSDVRDDLHLTAEFALRSYSLHYQVVDHGTLDGLTSQTVTHGSSGTPVTAVANFGYHFTDWDDGSIQNPRTDENVTDNLSLTARFAINQYTLTYTAGEGGSIVGDSPQTVLHGYNGHQVSADPDAHHHFVDWSDGSTSQWRMDTNVTADVSVTANFAVDRYTLTYTAGDNGSIEGETPQSVGHGSHGAAVTAVADVGYHFVNWSDGSTDNPRTDLSVTGDLAVTANFAINTYTLTYTAGANGSVDGASPQSVEHGADGTPVEAVPDTGYHFVQWSDGTTDNPRTDTNVTGDVSVTANFAVNIYTLTYAAGTGGIIEGASPQSVIHGENGSPVTAVADTWFAFDQWSDGVTANPRVDLGVTSDIAVEAAFAVTLPAPQNVDVGDRVYDTWVQLTWDSVEGRDRYQVYWSTSPDIDPADSSTWVGVSSELLLTTSYSVENLTPGTTYFFTVTALAGDAESAPGNEVFATPMAEADKPAFLPLNDTGLDWCADSSNIYWPDNTAEERHDGCAALADDFPRQDGHLGRDAVARADVVHDRDWLGKTGDGVAGFDFTKLGTDGTPLTIQDAAWDDAGAEVDGTRWSCVRDNHTGLVWEVKEVEAAGLRSREHTYTWYNTDADVNGGHAGTANGGLCVDAVNCDTEKYTAAVNAQTEALCGSREWRLPTWQELLSITHHGRTSGTAYPDEHYFPTVPEARLWTATPYRTHDFAWTVIGGSTSERSKSNTVHVMLVSAPPPVPVVSGVTCEGLYENPAVVPSTPASAFLDNGDGTVTDNVSGGIGHMWMRCSLGQEWDGATCTGSAEEYTWREALEAVEALNNDGGYAVHTDWRLPNVKELASIVENRCFAPAVNGVLFPQTPASRFWSSSSATGSSAWTAHIYGGVQMRDKFERNPVRLMRAGPFPAYLNPHDSE